MATLEINIIFLVSILLSWTKTIIGYHFPWETCQCCGKKYKEHEVKD